MLYQQDKAQLESTQHVTCKVENLPSCTVNFYVQNNVTHRGEEEEGFHIEAMPPNVGAFERTKYEVYIRQDHFHSLINSEFLKTRGTGYIGSRTRFDRLDITYQDMPFGLCKDED